MVLMSVRKIKNLQRQTTKNLFQVAYREPKEDMNFQLIHKINKNKKKSGNLQWRIKTEHGNYRYFNLEQVQIFLASFQKNLIFYRF